MLNCVAAYIINFGPISPLCNMVLLKLPKFHHHHRLLRHSFTWASSSLDHLHTFRIKITPSPLGVQIKAATSSSSSSASNMVKAIRIHELGGPEVLLSFSSTCLNVLIFFFWWLSQLFWNLFCDIACGVVWFLILIVNFPYFRVAPSAGMMDCEVFYLNYTC